ncbi:hypothetical protein PHYBLDRAFT_172708 [Phycomyces blakesleeanus NRRL 1555(-)]|uniref:Transcription factor IIIC subunit 5 HTH domain-containing protein n=1 Tax=Phycomyces blakesleeanus (strain ATCC 8743b / DSM 1359 / FGSC 10004 / NBRC 33097 / NRRL 1555) TaxID=763407 RepID=A0A162WLI3_PHYB8|nr:hypothetical protein PHYBLDRAFT_172708 [Phycomyces blakesleeanus NRRL 1555(-)]OAD68855.1 hypothetical protein PHYBLDRAFT_172708 [Phycomyces blakesleeanus NRRL 1555(-)]|eukprot:XP_018286895.1 hypothetical protein PHYBLDRAFT_172708 [Phycomyces blakesleeanus NRRL 1555(-)]
MIIIILIFFHRDISVLPSIAYTFRDGPWRFCWILYGIDPRKDSKYAKYQQVDTRKPVSPGTTVQPERNTRLTRGNNPFAVSVNTVNSTSASAKSQVFSAEATEPSTRSALYQLCDIGNEDIKSIINNPAYIKEVPTKRSGYYYDCVAHFLRDAVRRKIEDVKDRNDQESYESLVKSLPEKVEKEKEALLLGHSTEEIANDLGTMSNSFIDRIERGDIYADDSDYEDIEDIEDIEEIEEDEDIEDNGNEDDDDEDDDDDIVRSINKLDKGKRVRLEDLELDELLK